MKVFITVEIEPEDMKDTMTAKGKVDSIIYDVFEYMENGYPVSFRFTNMPRRE